MILAFDTYYTENTAKTVCIAFDRWEQEAPSAVHTETLDEVADYIPGEFYKRELPCILSLLKQIDLVAVEAIVVDGFVFLDDDQKPGLGAKLCESLGENIPVIGVAKTNFATIETLKRAVFRGESARPVYVTAIGTDVDAAAENVKSMHGGFRIPTLLKELDRLTKEA
jgi:deoxyribonuclease V